MGLTNMSKSEYEAYLAKRETKEALFPKVEIRHEYTDNQITTATKILEAYQENAAWLERHDEGL